MSTPPTTGPDRPAHVLDGLEQRVRVPEQLLRHEVRHARVDGGPEEAGREAGDEREARRSAPADVANGSAAKTAARRRSAATISFRRSSRSSSGPSVSPIDDRRQELDEEDAADPEAGVRAVLDVDRERDRCEQRPEARRERREEEQTEAGDAERRQLPGGAAGQSRLRVTGSSRYDDTPRKDVSERVGEDLVLLRRADRDADRLGAPKPASGRTITPCRSSCSKSARPSPTST